VPLNFDFDQDMRVDAERRADAAAKAASKPTPKKRGEVVKHEEAVERAPGQVPPRRPAVPVASMPDARDVQAADRTMGTTHALRALAHEIAARTAQGPQPEATSMGAVKTPPATSGRPSSDIVGGAARSAPSSTAGGEAAAAAAPEPGQPVVEAPMTSLRPEQAIVPEAFSMYAQRAKDAYRELVTTKREKDEAASTPMGSPLEAEVVETKQAEPPVAALEEDEAFAPSAPAPPARKTRPGAMRPLVPATPALQRKFPTAKRVLRTIGRYMLGNATGSAGLAVLTADSRIGLREASISAQLLVRMYREGDSHLTDLLGNDVDPALMMTDDRYAVNSLVEFFQTHEVYGVCEKAPTTSESDAHKRVIRAHDGPGVRINPILHVMWNADFDGDEMRVSFDPESLAVTRSAMDFLIGMDRKNKIDPDYFGMAVWGDKKTSIGDVLDALFSEKNGVYPIGLMDAERDQLARAIELSSQDDTVDEGFRLLLMTVRMISTRFGGSRDDVAANVLGEIWKMNARIRVAQLDIVSNWGYLGPVLDRQLMEEAESGLDPELEHLLSKGGPPSSFMSYSTAVSGPMGFVEKRAAHYRFIANMAKMTKAIKTKHFDSARGSAQTAEAAILRQIAGFVEFEDDARGLASAARDMVLLAAGVPDISSDDAFAAWLYKVFAPQHNVVSYAINSAIEQMGLNGSIVGYYDITMPLIPDVTTGSSRDAVIKYRRAVRSAFLKVYGSFTMAAIFGEHAPEGWENVTLHDYVLRNHASKKMLGDNDTAYDRIEKFIGRLADLRTSFEMTFYQRLLGGGSIDQEDREQLSGRYEGIFERMMAKNADGVMLKKTLIFDAMEKYYKNGVIDPVYEQDLVDLTNALYVLAPDAFLYHGIYSPLDFFATELGKRLVRAKSPSELLGVFYEVVARHRYAPIAEAARRRDEALARGDMQSARDAAHDLDHELDKLASSSDVWAAIVAAYRDPSLVAKAIKTKKKKETFDVFEDILFARIGQTSKDEQLARLVKQNPALRDTIKPWEVPYQLMAGPSGTFSNMRFTDYQGHSALLDRVDDSSKALDRWERSSVRNIIEEIDKAKKTVADDITDALKALASDSRANIFVHPHQIVDAALVGLEPSYASSEKGQQEFASSYIFQQTNYLVNGATLPYVTIVGDIAFGKVHIDVFQSSPPLIARSLTDPGFSIVVYDDTGRERQVSMLDNFGTTTPTSDEIWAWLVRNPRAAMALRQTCVANTIINKTGFSYATAVSDLASSLSELAHADPDPHDVAMKTLMDNFGFGAMTCLTAQMKGRKRAQIRQTMIDNFNGLIDLIAGCAGADTLELVKEAAIIRGIDWDRVENAYQAGLTAEEAYPDLREAPLDDPRYDSDYQLGQRLHWLARDLERYWRRIAHLGVTQKKTTAQDVAALLHLDDPDTMRTYGRAIDSLSGAKTEQSVSINAAMSKRFTPLLALSQARPEEPCDAPLPEAIPLDEFISSWHKHEGSNVVLTDKLNNTFRWPVNEATINRIIARSRGLGMVMVERESECSNMTMPCPRHATADPSTNFGRLQSLAIGRLLTVLRTESTEGMNMKAVTVGNDGTDSIIKIHNSTFQARDLTNIAKEAFHAAAAEQGEELAGGVDRRIVAAREALARGFVDVLDKAGMKGQIAYNDCVNIAHPLIRPRYDEVGALVDIDVLSLGQLNAIIGAAIEEEPEAIDTPWLTKVAENALASFDAGNESLDIRTVYAGAKVPSRVVYRAQITDKYLSATERNVEAMLRIAKEVNDKPRSAWDLDRNEAALIKKFNGYLGRTGLLESLIGSLYNKKGERLVPYGSKRRTVRITGIFPDEEVDVYGPGIGQQNLWIIDAKAKRFVDAMKAAYDRGLNVIVIGEPTDEQWDGVKKAMGSTPNGPVLDRHQGVLIDKHYFKMSDHEVEQPIGRFISMLDIRLNGGNTEARDGTFPIGVFERPGKDLAFIAESRLNEHLLSDADFVACKSWLRSVKVKMTGDYILKAAVMFGNLIKTLSPKGKSAKMPSIRMLTLNEVVDKIIEPKLGENADGLPQPVIDLGTSSEDAEKDFVKWFIRYVERLPEVDQKTGFLMSGVPNEILGWACATVGDMEYYHPIRLYEKDNSSGAPESFEITHVAFRELTQDLYVEWKHEGTLEGRTFKIFEDLAGANKMIGRAQEIDDIHLDNGLLLSGLVSHMTTASRRLFNKPFQLMMTLMYMARIEPFGYNIAEDQHNTFPDDEEFRLRVLSGKATIGEWMDRLADQAGDKTDIVIFKDDQDLNKFVNHLARKAIDYDVNPTVLFASRFTKDGVTRPNNLWFNFQVVFDQKPMFQDMLMRFLHRMMPELCPNGRDDEATSTLFNRDLKLLVPVPYIDENGETQTVKMWLDVYGGFHFFDEHFSGASNSGSDVRSLTPAQIWGNYSYRGATPKGVKALLTWSGYTVPEIKPDLVAEMMDTERD